MSKVFISYRRDDAKWQAREIYRALTQVLPREHVFMDVDSIPPGADFVDVLEGWVEECDILLALIGSSWIDVVDPKTGRRRLDNPQDFVRIEVRKGLERKIPVVPVLLDGAPIPDADRLPEDLKRLVRRNAEFVEHRTVDTDVERLINKLGLSGQQRVKQTTHEAPKIPQRAGPTGQARYIAEGRIRIDAKIVHGAQEGWFKPGSGKAEWFQDHEHGPEMVVVPADSFMMGSPESEIGRWSTEQLAKYDWASDETLHGVTLTRPFAAGRHSVTRGQFSAFVEATGHKVEGGAFVWKGDRAEHDPNGSWRSPGFAQDDSHPVVCSDWRDATAYTAWLSKATGQDYRLLSEAEWEYAARAGTTTPFWFGDTITTDQANYNGNHTYGSRGAKGTYRQATVPVGSFAANPWGLYQVHGNVLEWCEDVWHKTYNGAPIDGSPWTEGGDQSRRVVRGGSWSDAPRLLRSAFRGWYSTGNRVNDLGFRVGRTLSP